MTSYDRKQTAALHCPWNSEEVDTLKEVFVQQAEEEKKRSNLTVFSLFKQMLWNIIYSKDSCYLLYNHLQLIYNTVYEAFTDSSLLCNTRQGFTWGERDYGRLQVNGGVADGQQNPPQLIYIRGGGVHNSADVFLIFPWTIREAVLLGTCGEYNSAHYNWHKLCFWILKYLWQQDLNTSFSPQSIIMT